jgi:hypothetical protein
MMDKELQDALEAVKTTVTQRMDEMGAGLTKLEGRVKDAEQVVRSGPPDDKRKILSALIAPLKGESVQEIIRSMGENFLRVEAVKQVLPPLDIGVDLMTIFLSQPCSGITGKLAKVDDDPLTEGAAGDASDWSGTGPAVSLYPHHHYKSFDQHEAAVANIDVATEIGRAFFRRRNKTLKRRFVSGNGTDTLKGIEAYTVTHTWAEADKLFCEQIGAAGSYTIAQFRAGVQAAKNRLPEDATPVVMMRGDTIALAENDTENNVSYWKEVNGEKFYCGCLVIRNDYLSAASAVSDKIIAAVLAKGRGYGVLYNPELVIGADSKASKKNLYTGQQLGGAIADLAAIVGIEVIHG